MFIYSYNYHLQPVLQKDLRYDRHEEVSFYVFIIKCALTCLYSEVFTTDKQIGPRVTSQCPSMWMW